MHPADVHIAKTYGGDSSGSLNLQPLGLHVPASKLI